VNTPNHDHAFNPNPSMHAAAPLADSSAQDTQLTFPPEAMSGSLGEFARVMASGTEVPEEFYFAAGLTFLGATCGNRLMLNASLKVEPRLYTVLLGESADVKKSTALRNTADFFESMWAAMQAQSPRPSLSYGVGSAEGLANTLNKNTLGVLLCYDELKALIDKSRIDSSTLLPMVASLFEQTKYENTTKNHTLRVDDARLSIVGCCTTDTYASMWTPEAISIGFPNRLFVVSADRKRRVSWPEPRDLNLVEAIRQKFLHQLSRLPRTFDMAPDARNVWDRWYRAIPSSVHAKRLDSIGFRLLGLVALTNDRECIDLATVKTVVRILEYEFAVRTLTDPIDADRTVARLEEAIRRQLATHGVLTERELRRKTNADRHGLWTFTTALKNLELAQDICRESATSKKFRLKSAKVSSGLSSVVQNPPNSSDLCDLTPVVSSI
jgi:Protein of unknown function (DUF3987)